MSESPKNSPPYPASIGIADRPLADFRDAFIAVSCCGPERLFDVAQLLETRLKGMSVAEAIASFKCERCGQQPQAAYLQEKPYRGSAIFRNPGFVHQLKAGKGT